MAKVPTFEGGQRRAPLHRGNFTVRATPEAFGAATGRGLTALGQGVGTLSEAVSTVADLRAQNALKTAQADYMEGARALVSDPETGFLSHTGSDAINGLAAVEAQLEELGRGIAERLPGQVRPRFQDFRIGHNTNLGREMLRHKAEQTKAETRTASNRRIVVLKQEAVRNHTDPVAHLNSLTEAENEFRTMAGLEGLSDEVTEQKLAEYRDSVQSDIILQMAERDPLVAEARYEAVKDRLQEQTRQGIERRITPAVKIAKADAKAGALFAGLQADGGTDPVDHVTKFLVRNVANNAPYLSGDAASDTLSGSAEDDTLETPDQPETQQPTLQGPTLERARQLEEVDDLLRRRGDALAHRLNHAGVMLSPGNLIFAQALGAPLTIAFNEADPSLPAADVMAQAMGWTLSAEQLTELDQRLAGRSTGDFLAEFSTAAATLSGGPDVAAELAAISDPEERQFAEAGLSVSLSKATNQRRSTARERIAKAFDVIERGGSLSDLSVAANGDLTANERSQLSELQRMIAETGQLKTKFVVADNLVHLFETDIIGFAIVDLADHKSKLDKDVYGHLLAWQELIRNDEDQAEEVSRYVAALRPAADDHLRRASVTPENLQGEDEEKAARFRTRLLLDVLAFRKEKNRFPYPEETARLADQLQPLMPPEGAGRDTLEEKLQNFDLRQSQVWAEVEEVYDSFSGMRSWQTEEAVENYFQDILDKNPEELTPYQLGSVSKLMVELLEDTGGPEFERPILWPIATDRVTGEFLTPLPQVVKEPLDSVANMAFLTKDLLDGRSVIPMGGDDILMDDAGYVIIDGIIWMNEFEQSRELNGRLNSIVDLIGGAGGLRTGLSRPDKNTVRSIGGKGRDAFPNRQVVDFAWNPARRLWNIDKAKRVIEAYKAGLWSGIPRAQPNSKRRKQLDRIFENIVTQSRHTRERFDIYAPGWGVVTGGRNGNIEQFGKDSGTVVFTSVGGSISWGEAILLGERWTGLKFSQAKFDKSGNYLLKSATDENGEYRVFRGPAPKRKARQSQTGVQVNFEVFRRPRPVDIIAGQTPPPKLKISNVHLDVKP